MIVVFLIVVFMIVVFMIVVFMIQLITTIDVNRQQSIQFLIHFLMPRKEATKEQPVFVVTKYLRTEGFKQVQQILEQRFSERASPTKRPYG